MGRWLRMVWQNLYGLFVDDGAIAVGTLVAVGLTAGWAALTAADTRWRDLGGPLLFLLLMGLLLGNVHGVARAVMRRQVHAAHAEELAALQTQLRTPATALPRADD